MCTGGLFWLGNEVGHQWSMRKAFPSEYREAEVHGLEYRYLYGMLKETRGPREAVSALLPNTADLAMVLGIDGPPAEVDLRLDHAFRVVLESRALDCA
jgi:hypothetical protein